MSEGQKAFSIAEGVDPEVTPKGKRRLFSAAYKKKILSEMDAAAGSGNIGELLRREGIYSSTLTRWRRERDAAVERRVFSEARPGTQTKSVDRGERKTASSESTSAGRTAQSRNHH